MLRFFVLLGAGGVAHAAPPGTYSRLAQATHTPTPRALPNQTASVPTGPEASGVRSQLEEHPKRHGIFFRPAFVPATQAPLERGDVEGLKNQNPFSFSDFFLVNIGPCALDRTQHRGKRKVWPFLSRPFQRVRLVSAVGGRRGRGIATAAAASNNSACLKGWMPADFLTEQMSGVSRQQIAPLLVLTKQKSGVSRLIVARPPAATKRAGPTPVFREGGDTRLRTPGWPHFVCICGRGAI